MPAARLVVPAVAAVGILWWSRSDAAPSAPAPERQASGAAAAPGTSTVPAAPAREHAAAPTAVPATAPVQLRGRCLAAEDGKGVAALLRVGRDDGARVDDVGALLATALMSVTADADGRFTVAVPLAATSDLRVHATAADRAPAGARQADVAPGSTWDLGDILLQRTARVRGEVVDASAAPVADAEVGILMLGHEPPALQFCESHKAVTDARGAFAFAAPVAAGEWYVRCERTGALRTPRKLQVPEGGELVVRIEVERPDPALTLHGTVVDGTGVPLAGVELSAYGEGSRGGAVSGADGRFVLAKGPPHVDRGESGVEILAMAAGYEQASPAKGAARAWGERDLVVVMRPLGDFVVRALDARGAVVWPFQLTVGKCNAIGPSWLPRGLASQRSDGDHVVLPKLPGGRYSLVLTPADAALATTGPVPFDVDETSARELVVRVPDRVDAVVDVVDAKGAPVPGCTVELVGSLSTAPTEPEAPAPDLAAARRATVPGPRQLAVASARTGADGRAVLPAAPGPWLLRARCTTHRAAALPIVVAAGGAPHRVVLTPAAWLRGQLVPLAALPALGLGQQQPERRLAVQALVGKDTVARAEVAADGRFELGPLPPAAVALQLATWLPANPVSNNTMPHRLGSIDGAAPGVVERSFDTPQSDADMQIVADRERPCLAAYQATWKRSVISADRIVFNIKGPSWRLREHNGLEIATTNPDR